MVTFSEVFHQFLPVLCLQSLLLLQEEEEAGLMRKRTFLFSTEIQATSIFGVVVMAFQAVIKA
jgi:hypothetical protein